MRLNDPNRRATLPLNRRDEGDEKYEEAMMVLDLVNHLVCIEKIDYRYNLQQLREKINDLLSGEAGIESVKNELKELRIEDTHELEKIKEALLKEH